MLALERFFEHLKACGGCTGLRSPEICYFAVTCASVEVMARKGMIRSATELSPSIVSFPGWGGANASAGAGTGNTDSTASPGPCTVD